MAHSETFGANVNAYIRQIDEAKALWEVDSIVEHSAYDDDLTNDEYCTIYGYALNKYRAIEAGL